MVAYDPEIRIIAFDLDGTLTDPAAPIAPRMAALLVRLLRDVDVCVISGSAFDQLRRDAVDPLHAGAEELARLHLLPVSGTHYHRWRDGEWHEVYALDVPVDDAEKVSEVLVQGAKELGLWEPGHRGEVVQDRGNQVTYLALGADAPTAARLAWDPHDEKKERLRAYAAERLPGREVRGGGAASLDVTAEGVNKAYGMRELMEHLGLERRHVLYVGDRLEQNGNDRPVLAMGIRCVAVSRWQDTADFVERWLDCRA